MYRSIRAVSDAQFKRPGPDAIAIAVLAKSAKLPREYASLDRQARGALSRALSRPEFSANKGEVTTVYAAEAGSAGAGVRYYIIGMGDRDRLGADVLRLGGARLLRAAFAAKVKRLRIHVRPGLAGKVPNDHAGRALGEALTLANFEFQQFKGTGTRSTNTPKTDASSRTDLSVAVEPALAKGLQRGLLVAQSANITRQLAATPPNVANPQYLATFARKLARQVGLRCTVIDHRKARALNMNGLLAVGAAGSTPPALICLEHAPRRAVNRKPILLVGKAVTFDTGGYSIKPAQDMDKMKYDKSGGMAVIGALHAAARLRLPVHVVGLIPAAENMISPTAYRPSDILRMTNGVTVEVLNTDAEGRLILADALAYGCKTYDPGAVIDLATLTGGVVVALGTLCAGLFCSDANLRGRLFEASDQCGEKLWHLPLWEEHRQMIKGTHGDIVNTAGREASASQGAAFLSYFVGPAGQPARLNAPGTPWAHLDIAGVADAKRDTGLFPVGPTGYGVRLLVRMLEQWGR